MQAVAAASAAAKTWQPFETQKRVKKVLDKLKSVWYPKKVATQQRAG